MTQQQQEQQEIVASGTREPSPEIIKAFEHFHNHQEAWMLTIRGTFLDHTHGWMFEVVCGHPIEANSANKFHPVAIPHTASLKLFKLMQNIDRRYFARSWIGPDQNAGDSLMGIYRINCVKGGGHDYAVYGGLAGKQSFFGNEPYGHGYKINQENSLAFFSLLDTCSIYIKLPWVRLNYRD